MTALHQDILSDAANNGTELKHFALADTVTQATVCSYTGHLCGTYSCLPVTGLVDSALLSDGVCTGHGDLNSWYFKGSNLYSIADPNAKDEDDDDEEKKSETTAAASTTTAEAVETTSAPVETQAPPPEVTEAPVVTEAPEEKTE